MNTLLNIIKQVHAADDIVGTIALPSGVPSEVGQTGGLISSIVRFFIIIGGLFTLWSFLSGGFKYITSNGDKAKVQEAGNMITMSIVGLVVMAASFVIIAIVSQLLFGSFTAILAPEFSQVVAPVTTP
jgi:hypothetical protein